MQSHPQSQMSMEGGRGKMFWRQAVASEPLFLRILQRREALRPARAQLFEELQCVPQIR